MCKASRRLPGQRATIGSCLSVLGALAVVSFTFTVRPAAQATGLIAAYAFDEPSGSAVVDASGLGNAGTIQGATRAAGRSGDALSFDGTNDFVTVPNSTSLNPTTGLTIEAWVYPTRAAVWQTVVMKERPGGLIYSLYESDDAGNPSAWVRTSSSDKSSQGPTAVPLNTWTHLALTYNRSQLLVYVNGSLASNTSVTGNLATSTSALRIGGNSVWGEYFQGRIDDVRIYNRALSAAEIATDLNTPVSPPVADTAPPTAAVTAPANGATVSGVVTVSATASDNVGVAGVQFTLNGANLGTEDTSSPYSTSWNTSGIAPGIYVIGARARDAAGNQMTSAAVSVNVAAPPADGTPPAVALTSPANGATISGPTTLVAAASDNVGVVGVRFRVDGSDAGSEDTSAPFEIQWNPGSSPGAHTLTAVARDLAGNSSESSPIQVTVVAAPTTPGLVAAYGFEEAAGTATDDASGNGNSGVISGATRIATGRYGSALSFDGVNDLVTVADAPSLDLTTGMTLEAWVYPTALSGYRTVVMKEVPSELAYCLYAHDGSPRPAAYINTGTAIDPTVAGSSSLPLNTWSHLAATYNGSTLVLYVNGTQVGSQVITGSLVQSANALRFGGNAVWGEYFQGRLDDVRVYNRALTASEIAVDLATPVTNVASPPDSIPPTVSISTPAAGANVAGNTTLAATATDNVGIAGVQFQIDGTNVGEEDAASPYSLSWNSATVANGPHVVTAVARDLSSNLTTSTSVSVTVSNTADPASIGAWSQPVDVGIVAVHLTLLHTGKLLMWGGETHGGTTAKVWDPITFSSRAVPNLATNLFCAGHARLADGRILVAGGHDSDNGILGSADTNIFDPISESWIAAPRMAARRWYPTTTTLADGRVLATSGGTTCFTCIADVPEIYNPVTNQWTSLTAARLAFPYYPFTFVLPDGRVLNAGAGENPVATRVLDLSTQTWSMVDANVVDGGSAAMYRLGKVLKTGTSATTDVSNVPSARTAYVLDMTTPSPAWRQIASMAFPRAYHNSTLLPDGTVLITGGGRTTEGKAVSNAVYEAEMWSPATETWQTMARMTVPRLYHGTALLLPDARVLVSGSGDSYGGPNQTTAQFYSPPYLFKGPRPVISAAPAELAYATTFTIDSPDAAAVGTVSLIRVGSVTHQFDEDQRFLELPFTRSGNTLTVQAPAHANLAPPGHYMVFLVNTTGVPSTAAIVRFPSPAEDHESPSAPTGFVATGGLGRVDLSWAPAFDNTGVSGYNVHRSTVSGFTPTVGNRIAQVTQTEFANVGLAAGAYYFRVVARDVAGNLSAPSNQAFATATADLTPPTVSLTAPVAGSTVSGTVTLQATAIDNVGVAGVVFKLDGTQIGNEDTAAPFSISWNTAATVNGLHQLSAVARDAAGNLAETPALSVDVSNTQQAPAGLVAAYGFNEGAGVTTADGTGNGHLGTLSNATWTPSGQFGGALSFNGTDALVTVSDAASLDLTTGMTISAWVNPTASTDWCTVVMKERPSGLAYSLYSNNGASRPSAFAYIGAADRNANGSGVVPLNSWSHLAATYDGATLRLFVNGVQVGSQAVTGALAVSTGALRIGGNSVWGEYFQGRIDEVRIYNRALTAGEIQADMGVPIAGS
jgi:hypothetical protein